MSKPLSLKLRRLAEFKAQGMTNYDACIKAGYKVGSQNAACVQMNRALENEVFSMFLDDLRNKSTSKAVISAQKLKEVLSAGILSAAEEKDYAGLTALSNRLCKMQGWDHVEKLEVQHTGGVMLVPMAGSVSEWEIAARKKQEELEHKTIDV